MASEILTHTAPKRTFPFTPFLRQTHRHSLLPDHDSTTSATTSTHDGRAPSLVCKHWLRGLCKKGEHCEFLHEYNLRKMPECNFFTRNGYCSNGEECLYLHIDPQSKLPPCPHYEQGFCPLGPACAKKHVRRRLCVFYLAGFCPDGRDCKEGSHPRWRRDLERPRRKSDVAREEGELKKEDDAQMRDAPPRDAGRDREDRGFGGHMHRGGGRGGGGPGKWRGGGGGGGGRGRFRGRGH